MNTATLSWRKFRKLYNPNYMLNWTVLLGLVFCSGCSAFLSTMDKVQLIHRYNVELALITTPPGFVVSPQEVAKYIPLTKFGWNIYADSENYYLSSGIQKFTSKTGDNSWLAKQNGIRIQGTDRSDIQKLQKLNSQNRNIQNISPETIRDTLALEQ